jgi:hypothetical protein
MELFLNGRCSINSAPIITKLDAVGKSGHHLSFALLFSSIRAFSAKRTISKLCSNSRRATCNFQGGAVYTTHCDLKIYDSTFASNIAQAVSNSKAVLNDAVINLEIT